MATNYGLFNVVRQSLNLAADNVKHEMLSIGVNLNRVLSVKNQ
jgi:hypothetical protein